MDAIDYNEPVTLRYESGPSRSMTLAEAVHEVVSKVDGNAAMALIIFADEKTPITSLAEIRAIYEKADFKKRRI